MFVNIADRLLEAEECWAHHPMTSVIIHVKRLPKNRLEKVFELRQSFFSLVFNLFEFTFVSSTSFNSFHAASVTCLMYSGVGL